MSNEESTLTIAEALVEIRKKKEQVKRMYALRSEGFNMTVLKNASLSDVRRNPEVFDVILFNDITVEKIEPLEEELIQLRARVLRTNVETMAGTERLSTLLLRVATLKIRLEHLMELRESNTSLFGSRRKLLSADDEEKTMEQLTPFELEEMISNLEDEKTRLQRKIDVVNAKTKLLPLHSPP